MSVQIEMTKMSSCSVPANQSIYQALLDKAASYPADKPYQAKTYKKAAESVLTHTWNIYDIAKNNSWYQGEGQHIPGAGEGIRTFIKDFIKTEVFPSEKYSEKAVASKAVVPIGQPLTAQQIANIVKEEWSKNDEQDLKLKQQRQDVRAAQRAKRREERVNEQITPKTALDFYYESLKPVVYTAENPRRSRRVANKPKVEYFTDEEEHSEDSDEEYIDVDEDVAEAIETICIKKGWTYSDELVTDFETWLPTADKYSTQKYDYKTGKDIPRAKPDVAKYWAQYYSKNIQEQKNQLALSKALIKYCQKHSITYQDVMADKFAAWKADPANKKLITYTYTSAKYGWCRCASCDPTGEKKNATETIETKEYSYERSPAYCINKWFSTLKKTIVW